MFDNYLDQFRPAFRSVGDKACAYAERIIARLDLIADLVGEDENLRELKGRFVRTVTVTGDIVSIGVPPANRRWELDFVSARGFGGGGAAILMIDGTEVMYLNANDQATAGGNGLAIRSGEELAIRAAFDTGTTSMSFAGQYTVKTVDKPSRLGSSGGGWVWNPDASTNDELENVGRHSNGTVPGVNPIGERHG